MKRRIIKQGHNTLTITLPSEWVKKLNLKAGDEIDLSENEKNLILSTNGNNKEKSAKIDISNLNIPILWRFFQGAYRAGNNEIKIFFGNKKRDCEDAYHFYTSQFDYSRLGERSPTKPPLVMIQSIVDRFIGMGIIESGKDYCIIREMGEPTIKEFDNSLRRIFLVIIQMFERVIDAIKNDEINDTGLCKEIHTIDLNVDRFVDYCCRILNKVPTYFSDEKKMILFSTLYLLELAGDEFKYIGKHLAMSKKSVKEVLSLSEIVKEHFEMYYNMFYKFDREVAITFGEKDYGVYQEHYKLKDSLKGECRSIARHFMMISKLTFSLAELRIEMEF